MSEQQQVLEFRVATLEGAVMEIKTAVRSIDTSLQTLARLEAHHSETRDALSRAFADIGDHENRLRDIEAEMPTMRMIRNWVVAGVLGVVSMTGAALIGLVVMSKEGKVPVLPPTYSTYTQPALPAVRVE